MLSRIQQLWWYHYISLDWLLMRVYGLTHSKVFLFGINKFLQQSFIFPSHCILVFPGFIRLDLEIEPLSKILLRPSPFWCVRQKVARRPCATRGKDDNELAYLGKSPRWLLSLVNAERMLIKPDSVCRKSCAIRSHRLEAPAAVCEGHPCKEPSV